MARINLLPWRENLRRQRQRQFFVQLGGAVVVGLLALVLWHLQIQNQLQYQHDRNAYLKAEIAKLDKKIKEIRDLEKVRSELVARMNVIETLQTSRPMVVHLFDELVKTIPEGVYLDSLVQKGRSVTLEGWAQSNARISAYMRAIDNSKWLKKADLKSIRNENKRKTAAGLRRFKLVVTQANPTRE